MTARALVIGIQRYAHGARFPSVLGAGNDRRAWARLLTATYGLPAADVRQLADGDATEVRVMAALDWLFAAPAHDYLFFFVGHGDVVGHPGAGEEVLVCADARGGGLAGMLRDSEILRPGVTGRVTLVLDACFAGGFDPPPVGRGRGLSGRVAYRARWRGPVRRFGDRPRPRGAAQPPLLISAARSNEQSFGDGSLRRGGAGLFTHFATQRLTRMPSTTPRALVASCGAQIGQFLHDRYGAGFAQHPVVRGGRQTQRGLVRER